MTAQLLIAGTLSDKNKNDTIIFFNELNFTTEIEKDLFQKIYNESSDDYFSLFYIINSKKDTNDILQAKNKLADHINDLKSKRVAQKDPKKAVKIIYNETHNLFFKKYELENHFNDVFDKGYYNCLSATAIFALILNELNIPYQINVYPNHVNLTVYPNDHGILIETTDPVKGYFSYDSKFKEKYISNLVDYKMIDKSELYTNSIDSLFDQYYSNDEKSDLKGLVGLQYLNEGIFLSQKEIMDKAIEQVEKAYLLYPNESTKSVLIALYSQEINNSDYSNEKHIDYLMKLLRCNIPNLEFDTYIHELNKVAKMYLFNKNDSIYFHEFCSKMRTNEKSDSLDQIISLHESYNFGDYYIKQLKYDQAKEYYFKALKIDSLNSELERFYVSSIIMSTENIGDKRTALKKIESEEEKYSKIKYNRILLSYKAELFELLMMQNFERNNAKDGENYRNKLETILENNDVQINEINIGISYAQAGSYYFRKGNKAKAKLMFEKGLEYSPGNYELESRLRMMGY